MAVPFAVLIRRVGTGTGRIPILFDDKIPNKNNGFMTGM
jgi:hypothetical protein